MVTYEQLLDHDTSWAFLQGSLHFENASYVHKTLRRFTRRLDQLAIPHAIVGAMAMFFHGYRRYSEDVDVLVTEDGLAAIHELVAGSEFVCPGQSRRLLRHAELGVRVDLVLTGSRPAGKGAPAVVLPHPSEASIVIDGVSSLTLPKLIEMKLAAGMTHPRKHFHLGDVQEMIKKLDLPGTMAEELHPDVRDQYRELWQPVQDCPEEPVEWHEWDRGP